MLLYMNYRNLGKSGLKVSQLCLGTNNFGGQINEEASLKIVNKALDCGINVIDTANIYTDGKSEEIIGKAVKGRRDEVTIATKVGFGTIEGPNQSGLSRKHILNQVEHSLKSLQTDFIDVYYMHRFDPETPLEETLRTFDYLVRQAKVRYIACSNFAAWQIAKANEICENHSWEKLIAVQPPYNLLQRDIEEDIIPYSQQEGLGILTYTPLMGGFLTGKYSKASPPPAGSRFEYNPRLWKHASQESNFALLEQIENMADDVGIPVSKLAIAWILKNPAITAPIVGASSVEQVEENSRIVEINLDNGTYQRLNELTKGASFSLYS
jgi:aryl-alcohol dehydrogenase-like predicted oxidoreductase